MTDIKKAANDLGELVSEKGAAYGEIMGSTEAFLSILYPDGIPPEMYSHVGLQVRIFDKLRRSAHAGHDFSEDWRDIAGYGLQGLSHYTDPIHQRMIEDSQVEAEQRETHGECTETHEQLVRTAKWRRDEFCVDRNCGECPLSAHNNVTNEHCGDFIRQHPQLALDLMEGKAGQ